MFKESIKIAITNIWASKMRSFLTMLGVIIGVSSVVIMMSIGEGAKKGVENTVKGLGTNIMEISPGKIEKGQQFNMMSTLSVSTLKEEDVDAIRKINHVEKASPIMIVGGMVKTKDKVSSSMLIASAPEALEIINLELTEGKAFGYSEYNASANVAVMDYVAKEKLFGDGKAEGDKFTIRNEEFTLGGVFKLKGQMGGQLVPVNFDDVIIIPFSTAKKITGQSQIFRINAQADSQENIEKVKEGIKTTLIKMHDGNEDFSIITQDDVIDIAGGILDILTILITAIASISLVVGGIGIMNMMLVTVTERTKEIGIRKAIGATKKDILLQFLIEAMVISFVGAMLGFALGMFGQFVITRLTTAIEPYLSLKTIYSVIGMAFGVGIVFGLLPAFKAANKNPIEALRWE